MSGAGHGPSSTSSAAASIGNAAHERGPPGIGANTGRRITSQSSVASSATGYSASTGGRTSYVAGNGMTGQGSSGSASGSSTGAGGHLESTVTKLLVSTKQLLEGLTDWSQGKISEEQVSDIYVRLGNCFNAAVAAFSREGISMKDLKEIPQLLRIRLEAAINEEASTATLNEHLPKIRPIILDLLRGLREKQDRHAALLISAAEKSNTSSELSSGGTAPGPSSARISGGHSSQPTVHAGSIPTRQASLSSQSSQTSLGQSSSTNNPASGHRSSKSNLGASSNLAPRSTAVEGRVSPIPSTSGRPALNTRQASFDADSGPALLPIPSTSASYPEGHDRRAASETGHSSQQHRRPSGEGREMPVLTKSKSSSSIRSNRREGDPPAPAPDAPLPPLPSSSGPKSSQAQAVAPPRPPLPLPGTAQLGTSIIGEGVSLPSQSLLTPNQASTASSSEAPRQPSAFATPPRSVLRPIQGLRPGGQGDDASLEALKKADPLARRASKRFSQYTMNKMSTSVSMGVVSSPSSAAMSSALSGTMPGRSLPMDRDDSAREYVQTNTKSDPNDPQRRRRVRSPKANNSELPEVPALPPLNGLPILSFSPDTFGGKKRFSVVAEETEDELNQNRADDDEKSLAQIRAEQLHPDHAIRRPSNVTRKDSVASVASTASRYSANPSIDDTLDDEAVTPTPGNESVFSIPANVVPIPVTQTPHLKTVFLQLGRDMKKAKLDMREAPTIASLRMLFTERFTYNPGLADFPAIYLRDPASGVQYELENLEEISDHCVLSLNVEPLDQVKQHIDEGLAGLAKELRELKTSLNSNRRASIAASAIYLQQPAAGSTSASPATSFSRALPTISDSQPNPEAAVDINIPPPLPTAMHPDSGSSVAGKMNAEVTAPMNAKHVSLSLSLDLQRKFGDIQNARREVAALRQLYVDFRQETTGMLNGLRTQTERVKDLATSNVAGSRAFIDSGKIKLDNKSQDLLTKIEELQDSIDDLKNDVISRRIKPKPKQLEAITTAMRTRQTELDDLSKYIATVKPMWKKTWEAELQNIVEEQQLLNHQEELLTDLKADHENVVAIFEQIQQYVSLRQASGGRRPEYRPPSPEAGHEGLRTVMLEVKGLSADPAKRMKAIEQAEKARKLEASHKANEFASELNGFVEGKMLKRTGGAEETERVRQLKSEATIKAMFSAPVPQPPKSTASLSNSPLSTVKTDPTASHSDNARGVPVVTQEDISIEEVHSKALTIDVEKAESPNPEPLSVQPGRVPLASALGTVNPSIALVRDDTLPISAASSAFPVSPQADDFMDESISPRTVPQKSGDDVEVDMALS